MCKVVIELARCELPWMALCFKYLRRPTENLEHVQSNGLAAGCSSMDALRFDIKRRRNVDRLTAT